MTDFEQIVADPEKRFRWGYYVLAMLVPVAGLVAFNAGATGTWLRTGACPGGAMDRPAGPCGPLDFVWIVLLGGWAAFLVVPLLVAGWLAITLYFVVAARSGRRQG